VAFGGLPVQATQRVFSWIEYFTGNGRQEFLLWLIRSESFRNLVVPLLEKEGLPAEFFFLAMIESGFSNLAYSRSNASGTWQFMKPTARHYGLDITYWVDERRDPVKSTMAAARYLKDLHRQFRDWYFAIAAYNAGPNKVNRAIRGANSRNYWALSRTSYLLPETKNYVPKMLAALIVASHPEHYGFSVAPDLRNTMPLTMAPLKDSHRLSDIATHLDLPIQALQRWNPELLRGVTPPSSSHRQDAYWLRLPPAYVEKFKSVSDDLVSLRIDEVQMHSIKKGETLAHIARQYQISLQQLLKYNPDLHPARLKPGQSIAVPVPAVAGTQEQPSAG
jgi:membrane-bound lytic murein transglycosylase D